MATGADPVFAGSRLRLARAFAGYTQAELGERIAVSHQFVGYLEAGQKQPTTLLAEAIGEACGFEPSFFFGPSLDEFRDEECHFRRRQATPIFLRTRLLAYGTLFGQLVDFLDDRLALPSMNVPEARIRSREDIESAAEMCRLRWGLGRDLPISNMTRVLENAGVALTRFDGAAEKIDAFSRSGSRAVVVLNADKGSASRSRFDMAHECGHLVMHRGQMTGAAETEREADDFASAFLLPRAGIVREFPRLPRLDWPTLFRLKARWRVSLAALIRRAYDLRLIDAMEYRRAYKYMASRGWRKGEPGEFEAETPELVPLAFRALESEGVSARDVVGVLGWRPPTLEKIVGIPAGVGERPTRLSTARVIHIDRQSR